MCCLWLYNLTKSHLQTRQRIALCCTVRCTFKNWWLIDNKHIMFNTYDNHSGIRVVFVTQSSRQCLPHVWSLQAPLLEMNYLFVWSRCYNQLIHHTLINKRTCSTGAVLTYKICSLQFSCLSFHPITFLNRLVHVVISCATSMCSL